MGASGWSYFVPYEKDISATLEKLRQDVFQRGDYLLLEDWELLGEADDRIEAGEDPAVVDANRIAQRAALPKPSTIDELFEWNEESGTHSIIDMIGGVSIDPAFGTVSPLTNEQLRAAFGTGQPTHAQIEQWAQVIRGHAPISDLRRRWEGLYIVIYEDDTPAELYFAGFSGD